MPEQQRPKTIEDLRRQVAEQNAQGPQPTSLSAGVQMPPLASPGTAVPDPEDVADYAVRRRPNGFVAAEEVPDTKYDLNPYADATGEIPQPTNERWRKYARRMAEIGAEQTDMYAIIEEAGPQPFRGNPELLVSITDATERMLTQQREALADLCNGKPTRAQINKLPDQVFQSFQVWVQGLFGPKA